MWIKQNYCTIADGFWWAQYAEQQGKPACFEARLGEPLTKALHAARSIRQDAGVWKRTGMLRPVRPAAGIAVQHAQQWPRSCGLLPLTVPRLASCTGGAWQRDVSGAVHRSKNRHVRGSPRPYARRCRQRPCPWWWRRRRRRRKPHRQWWQLHWGRCGAPHHLCWLWCEAAVGARRRHWVHPPQARGGIRACGPCAGEGSPGSAWLCQCGWSQGRRAAGGASPTPHPSPR
jgi:hypothetical protein